jgi:hypothetical protein
MKKKIISGTFTFALLVGASYGVNKSMKSDSSLSDLVMVNVEALAITESGGGERIICYNEIEGIKGSPMEDKTWCNDCKARPASKWSIQSECPK